MFTKTLLRHIKNSPLLQQQIVSRQLATGTKINKQTGTPTTKRKRNNFSNTNKMQRTWMSTNSSSQQCNNQFTLVSYNILAQDLLMEHMCLYTDIPIELLQWEGRLERLSNEINSLEPDILCVQELQYAHLNQFVQQIQQQRQMEYVYKKKTNHRTDGCAIIYDRQKFKLIAEQPLEYFYPYNDFLNRGNIAIIARFQVRAEPAKQFIVATTHLLFNPAREDVRVAQAQLLMETLENFSQLDQEQPTEQLPIILTGDFNSQEFQASSNFLRNPRANLQFESLHFGNEAVSTFQEKWVKVDHVYVTLPSQNSRHKICICNILHLPSYGQCAHMSRLPNAQLGSDHFSLALKFSII